MYTKDCYTTYSTPDHYLPTLEEGPSFYDVADANIREVARFAREAGDLIRAQLRYIEVCTGCLDSQIEE